MKRENKRRILKMYHLHENNDPNNPERNYPEDRYVRHDSKRDKKSRTLLYSMIGGIAALLLIVVLIFTLGNKDSHYETGLEYLRAKQYNAALTEFQYVTGSDKEFTMAQSKINFINGVKAYNNNAYTDARVYLSKVDERDEFYQEAKLMMDQIAANERNDNLEKLLTDNQTKDTIIKERIIETPSNNNNNSGNTNNNNNNNNTSGTKDELAAKKYISSLQSVANKFNAAYQSGYTASIESKRNYVGNMQSLMGQLNGLSYTASDKNAMVLELKGMLSKWMSRRIDFINRLISDNTVTESSKSRALKEEGDKLYSMAMGQMSKVKSYYNI